MKNIFKRKHDAHHAHAMPYPWRLFGLYLVVGIAGALSILPYLLSLLSLSGNSLPVPLGQIITEQILQSAIILVPAVGLGLLLMDRVKLDSPYLRALVYGKKMPHGFPRVLGLSVALGFVSSVIVSIIDLAFVRDEVLSNIQQVNTIPVAWRFLTALYGGIDEELLMRLFLFSLVAWIGWKVWKAKDGGPTKTAMWIALVVTTGVFALSHMPVTSTMEEMTALVVIRSLVLNGIGGAVFGWLYWKKGLEAAIIAHFAGDVTLQVIIPWVLGFFA